MTLSASISLEKQQLVGYVIICHGTGNGDGDDSNVATMITVIVNIISVGKCCYAL